MKQKILRAAIALAEKTPLDMVTRHQIAKRAEVAPGLVSYYLGTMEEARALIIQAAVDTTNIEVLTRVCMSRPELVPELSPEVKAQIVGALFDR